MQRYVTIEKREGETPLAAVEAWREKARIPRDVPLAYAGRLDPMASGMLLVLIGDECKRQKAYHGLDKAYEVSIVLGLSTDSGDVLGLAKRASSIPNTPSDSAVHGALRAIRGQHLLPYPPFSSKTVRGKPLFHWTLEGRLNEIEIPLRKSRVYATTHRDTTELTASELLATATRKIDLLELVTEPTKRLGADWRRETITNRWHELLTERADMYPVVSFEVVVSSGTYIRSLATLFATQLGTTGMVLSLRRTTIGRYLPFFGGHGLWLKRC